MSEIRTSIKNARIIAGTKKNIAKHIIAHAREKYQKFEEFLFSDLAEKIFIKIFYVTVALGFIHIFIHILKVIL